MQYSVQRANWSVRIDGQELVVSFPRAEKSFSPEGVTDLRVSGRFRKHFVDGSTRLGRLKRLPRRDVERLQHAIGGFRLLHQITQAVVWHDAVVGTIDAADRTDRWLTQEQRERLDAERPPPGLLNRLSEHPGALENCSEGERDALEFLDIDLRALIDERNRQFTVRELEARRRFFDSIEKSPLTDEQAIAVLTYDNRVQVVAAAGSGKTSVMVARAAYAVDKGLTTPDRILLLAFNKDAAAELQTRVTERMQAAGLDPTGVVASTFHAFGLRVVGDATGRKPRLAPWLDQDDGAPELSRIIDHLSDTSTGFRYKWHLFRLVLATETSKEPDQSELARAQKLTALDGTVVKSKGELMIANFLYLNGVPYQYEKPFKIDTADSRHSQYHPDFYYPNIDTWHEHWGVDLDGRPPSDADGNPQPGWKHYESGMRWKQQLHSDAGTDLIETTWGEIVIGDGLVRLEQELKQRGQAMDWNPTGRELRKEPVRRKDLIRLIRTFMSHVKANSHTPESLEAELSSGRTQLAGTRTRIFLDLFWPILDEWNRRLREGGYVDFDDMLLEAANHLEQRRVPLNHDLILVDEFQDSSRTRARVVAAMVNKGGKHLLTVGDDWQAINRFAGADISVMTEFARWFGDPISLRLTKTFRCTQEICDVSTAFIRKNPRQIPKAVVSASTARGEGHGARIELVLVGGTDGSKGGVDKAATRMAISEYLERTAIDQRDKHISVFALGRYNFERELVPTSVPDRVSLEFKTVHRSKGLEADFVIVPNLRSGLLGFPSGMEDDPLLELAMPSPDPYPSAEERRLFYVALTRARKGVVLFAALGIESPFVRELLEDGHVTATDGSGGLIQTHPCPDCGAGLLIHRSGRRGDFFGCSRFPSCDATGEIGPGGLPKMHRRCPRCGFGKLVERSGRYGMFLGCTSYPDCDYTLSSGP